MDINQKLREKAEQNKEEITEVLCELLKFKSITGTEEEKEAVEYIKSKMEEYDYDDVFVDSIGNIVGKVGDGPKTIVYDAHIDIVDAQEDNWSTDPFDPVVKDGEIFGRGAMDCKGPLVAMLFGGKLMKELDVTDEYTIYIVGSVSEETCEGLATASFIDEYNLDPEQVVIAEASDLKICYGHRGRAVVEATFSGTPVHASRHYEGDNPLDKALPFAQAVSELDQNLPEDDVLGKGNIVATTIETDNSSVNTVAAKCRVLMDRRMVTCDSRESVIEELRELPNGDKAELSFVMYEDESYNGYKKKGEEFFPAWVMDPEHELIKAGEKTYTELFDEEPTVSVWGFSTNGTYTMGDAQIPTLGFGPGKEEYCHGADERVEIDSMVKAAAFYAALPSYL